MNRRIAVLVLGTVLAATASAQFTGPSLAGRPSTVAQVQNARVGSYVTLTGNIVAHRREDYYLFRDGTGEISVEISASVFNNRKVSPESKVRLVGEIDRGIRGRYVWISSLEVIS